VSADAPDEKPVTVPNHLNPPADLNASAGRPLNSKRHEAFRSTAIERNPLSRSDCGPQEGKRLGAQTEEGVSRNREGLILPIDVDARIDQLVELPPQASGAPREGEELIGQLGMSPRERGEEVEADSISNMPSRQVGWIFEEGYSPGARAGGNC
jgi:hypothetical protein